MSKWLMWLKRGVAIVVVGGLLPLYVLANVQSLADHAERLGLSSTGVGTLGKAMGANLRIMWWKILGAMPTSSLLPWMGQNWAAIDDTRQKYKWGGCSLVYDESEDMSGFNFAKGFARCTGVSDTVINPGFADLSEEQRRLLDDVKNQLPPGEYGPRDYEEVAYAIMTNMETMGVGNSKSVMDRLCAKAYLGAQSARLDCFALLELVQTLEEVEPKNEMERRAVAVKAGGSAWFWAFADERLGGLQLASLRRLESSKTDASQKRVAVYARAAQWSVRYAASEEARNRFSVMALRHAWGKGDLAELNEFLILKKRRPMDRKYWDEASGG